MSDPTPPSERPGTPEEGPREVPTVVGVGASAGGLAALKEFFDHVPEDSGLAFVIVVHLSPEHESHLAELLQPSVRVPVQQVTETTELKPDHVYVIPPGRNLSAVDTHLRLTPLEERRRNRAPVDHFFRTLAATYDGHSIGVILTGTGSDGALGVREIKERNGLVVVQDPNEAEYDGMPQSAITTGVVDWVLPLADVPGAILRFARTEPSVNVPAEDEPVEADERQLLQRVLAQVRARTGRDFSRYKSATVLRRITRRMQICSVEDLDAYLKILRGTPTEVASLADDLLINVTSFFRDPEVFDRLAETVVPGLFEGRGPDQAVRVWSVGCATGEEAYSLAILLFEEAARLEEPATFQVFASDLHEHSLERARDGFYAGDIEADVSAERLRRFFRKEDGGYRIRKEIREAVVFAPHNLLSDPPFSKLDLVSCRNLLIYLQRDVQREVMDLFHYALHPDGVLVLGSSETADAGDLFRTVDKPLCFYRKRNVPAPDVRLPVFPITHAVLPSRPDDGSESDGDVRRAVSFGALHEQIVERYGPPSVLVGPEDRVVHVSAQAGRYLVHPGGEITTHALKLVRPELRPELRTALYAARERSEPVRTDPVAVEFGGHSETVALDVRPSPDPEHEGYVLVLFDERPGPVEAAPDPSKTDDSQARLHSDLDRTRQRLQALVEEYETSQEEMRAANEELQSANEELRSTMEELETSKEELQSMNEELQTVNQENRHKVEELAQLSGDLKNLMAATQIATLLLDRELRIVRFTPGVADLFSVRLADRGRPLADLTHRLGYDDLLADAERVLATLVPVEREVSDDGDRGYLARVLPYRSAEDRIEGVVITFVDITARRASEVALRQSEEHYRLLVEGASEYAILLLDLEGCITGWNTGAKTLFGYAEADVTGHGVDTLFTSEDRAAGQPEAERKTALEDGQTSGDRWHLRADGSRFWASGVTTVLRADGEVRGFAKVLRDNTEQKEAQDALRDSEARYRSLFESISEGFSVIEMVYADGRPVDYRFVETNPAFERQSGLEAVDGRTVLEAIPDLDPFWIETYARVAETGQRAQFVQESTALDRWYEVEAFRVGEPESRRVAVLFTDVSEQRAAEQALRASEARFRQAVDAARLGTWDYDVTRGAVRLDERAR
ncbi:chemotaxis protein CheB, partial [Rubrivirga sp.]|uniref:chemotaxis protein CheB n=1 Tax=Rubrivirga sp. TaxID=1885344 RepID=UPI003C7798F9